MLESATTLTYERYQEIRKTYSCTHTTTLTCLRDLVMLYQKQSKTELSYKELRSLIVECITKVTTTKELIETGRYLAEVYRDCGYVQHAHDTLHGRSEFV